MVSILFPISLLSHLRPAHTRSSCARVFCDTGPSPSQAFEADLAASLQKLTHANISSADLVSLGWMCKALDVVIAAGASAKQPLHTQDKQVSNTMDQYMEEYTVKMLDVCCLVKDSLEGAGAYVKACHRALKRLQGQKLVHRADAERAKHAILSALNAQERPLLGGSSNVKTRDQSTKNLSACSSMLRRMGDRLSSLAPPAGPLYLQDPGNTGSMASSALYGAGMCTLFLLRTLSKALSSPASSPRSRSSSLMTPLHISGQAAWVPSLLSLQAQLNQQLLRSAQRRTQGCMTLLPEFYTLEASMKQVYDSLLQVPSSKQRRDDLSHLVDSTSKLIYSMDISIARLHQQIERIFSSLVDTRMAMLH